MKQHQEYVNSLREQFPTGTRIKLCVMKDPYAPVPPGTEGVVQGIDDAGSILMRWSNGQGLSLIPGVDRFAILPPQTQTMKLYMPLTAQLYEFNSYGDMENEPCDMDSRELAAYADSIHAAILRERRPEEKERGLMRYYREDDTVSQKVKSYVFSVEEQHGKLWGVAECEIFDALTDAEMACLQESISGQASDGAGESFEQRPIPTSNGELYVSLWSSDKSWHLMSEDELHQSQQMGGMKFE